MREPDQDLEKYGIAQTTLYFIAANQAWANIAALASNFIAWLQISCIPTSHRARFWDVKRFRYRLFSTAGKITLHGRRTSLLLPDSAPEKDLIKTILAAINNLNNRSKRPTLTPI